MPVDTSLYPEDWATIRRRVLLRAGGDEDDPRVGAICEWCGLQNYIVGYRLNGRLVPIGGNAHLDYLEYATDYRSARDLADHQNEWGDGDYKYIVVVLTVAHIYDRNPKNVDMSNLAALCQQCHIRWNTKWRMEQRRVKQGLPLFAQPLEPPKVRVTSLGTFGP